MLENSFFYHHTIRKQTVAFGQIFSDIFVHRVDEDHALQKELLVPLSYAEKEKWMYRIKQNPTLVGENVAIQIPRMAFQMDNIVYDQDRKLQSVTQTVKKSVNNQIMSYTYTPVPYNFNYSLFIVTDTVEDAAQILEQILVFFRPEYTTTINVLPEMDIVEDVPIVLNTVTKDDNFDTDFEQKRLIIWTLGFTMKSNIYGAVKNQGIIREVIANLHDVRSVPGSSAEQITCEDIANSPTTVKIDIVPDPIDANPDDDYGYTTTITENE